jgi:hypothetical protein
MVVYIDIRDRGFVRHFEKIKTSHLFSYALNAPHVWVVYFDALFPSE